MKFRFCYYIVCVIFFTVSVLSCEKNQSPPTGNNSEYSVFAWNDLGMNCLNPSYDKLVILPPSNNILVQVVKRGAPPGVVTANITVSYKITNNTTSYNKRSYGGFWDNALKLFGVAPAHDIGLKGNGLTGNMSVSGDHFIAEGIPVVPVNDNGTWNPYQVAEITVKDAGGKTLAQTQASVPVSDEINCAKCHGSASVNVFDDILSDHDLSFSTHLSSATAKPVLCAGCHPSPILGINTGSQIYLSQAIHQSHATKPGIGCYDCHPGETTKCNRSLAHTAANGNCTQCHGEMANVASTIAAGRIPWASEPVCVTCHTGTTGVSTGTALYHNSKGHGGMYCTACHGGPHAMYPSREITDNYQSIQYQGSAGKVKTIGSCGVCHETSRGLSNPGGFAGKHGNTNPEIGTGCNACHTSVPVNTASWPHAFTWKNSNI